MYIKNKMKEVRKIIKKENKELREQKRIKSGYYQKLTALILAIILLGMSFITWQINGLYDNLIEETQSVNTKVEQVEEELNYRVEPARITCYLATGNTMANGEYPSVGQVAISDRSIPLNTKVELNGIEYNIGDRTNKRFESFDLMTIDIFVDWTEQECLDFGVQYGFVKIFDK
jgi:hypothetical protein